ncbi:YgiW/YdeI family stress tolerance OB fold protein [Pandoraea pulmonicola]|uniref:Uncharacterized conserved protein n=1 Tax=Pandoraea pulmonicola TaxID=93221 RepID=A0AAJ5D319_PANPU|nr:NirD/YgiW/YdeI family stress tolerance protein [Pandoraea pulmonicola]AJC22524.1 hypothetical protein RO07_22315 [Pandoraea pulmonicola]SUA93304.1 Uncharacterized conserved protein [Pandoraea pulmonicola]
MSKNSDRRRSLGAAALLAAGSAALIGQAHAQYTGPSAQPAAGAGAIAVPTATPHATTVEQALAAPDDATAVIEGFIVNKLKHEHYTFRDAAGKTIEIDLDDKYLPPGQVINDKTRVRITGEVDRHRFRPNDIDVKRIEILR